MYFFILTNPERLRMLVFVEFVSQFTGTVNLHHLTFTVMAPVLNVPVLYSTNRFATSFLILFTGTSVLPTAI